MLVGLNKVGNEPSFMAKCFENPALYSPRLEKQSSVKCCEHNKRDLLYCSGIVVKMNFSHWFFWSSFFGSENKTNLPLQLKTHCLLDMMLSHQPERLCGGWGRSEFCFSQDGRRRLLCKVFSLRTKRWAKDLKSITTRFSDSESTPYFRSQKLGLYFLV